MNQYQSYSVSQINERISTSTQLANNPYVRLVVRMIALSSYAKSGTEESYQQSINPIWSGNSTSSVLELLLSYIVMKQEDPASQWCIVMDHSGRPALYNGKTAIFLTLPAQIGDKHPGAGNPTDVFLPSNGIYLGWIKKEITPDVLNELLAGNSRFVGMADQMRQSRSIIDYVLDVKLRKGMNIILDKYPFPDVCPHSIVPSFPSGKDLIKYLLKRVDPEKVGSAYGRSMVRSLNDYLVTQLYESLTNSEINTWKRDPNDEDIIDFIEEQGFALYNHFYLGNPGYESTLQRTNPNIRL